VPAQETGERLVMGVNIHSAKEIHQLHMSVWAKESNQRVATLHHDQWEMLCKTNPTKKKYLPGLITRCTSSAIR
jgi:hypothetical protein